MISSLLTATAPMVACVILFFVALGYRRKAIRLAAKAQYWFDQYNEVKANHQRLVIRNLFEDQAPKRADVQPFRRSMGAPS